MAKAVSAAPEKSNGHRARYRDPSFILRLRWLLPAVSALAACSTLAPSSTPASPQPSRISSTTAAARDPVLDALIAQQERVYRVAAPIIIKSAVLCRTQARPLLGFTAKNQYSYPPELMPAARRQLGLDERLQVMQILDGSGAMRAGLARGDILQSLQDIAMPQGPQAETEAARLLAPALKNLTEIRVTVLRQGQTLNLQVPLTLACAFAIDIGHSPNANAYSDGKRILLTRGLLEQLQADDEIAAIIAREIAHNVLQHARQLQQTATLSGVIDSLLPLKPEPSSYTGSGGIKPLPEKMDQEADRLALFMLARAGYDTAALARASERLVDGAPASPTTAQAIPQATSKANTYNALHPWTAERRSLIQATITEIRQKQAARKPLVP